MESPQTTPTHWIAGAAGIFGLATIWSGGAVLFGPLAVRQAAGNAIPFVVWFNTFAGVAYLAAAGAIWRGTGWARTIAWGIAGATALMGLAFGAAVLDGTAFEMRTAGALIFRTMFWVAIALFLRPRRFA